MVKGPGILYVHVPVPACVIVRSVEAIAKGSLTILETKQTLSGRHKGLRLRVLLDMRLELLHILGRYKVEPAGLAFCGYISLDSSSGSIHLGPGLSGDGDAAISIVLERVSAASKYIGKLLPDYFSSVAASKPTRHIIAGQQPKVGHARVGVEVTVGQAGVEEIGELAAEAITKTIAAPVPNGILLVIHAWKQEFADRMADAVLSLCPGLGQMLWSGRCRLLTLHMRVCPLGYLGVAAGI